MRIATASDEPSIKALRLVADDGAELEPDLRNDEGSSVAVASDEVRDDDRRLDVAVDDTELDLDALDEVELTAVVDGNKEPAMAADCSAVREPLMPARVNMDEKACKGVPLASVADRDWKRMK